MSGPALFILVWSVLAILMGLLFAFRPDAIEAFAERRGQRRMMTQRMRRFQVHLNRVGGVLFVAVGLLLIVLVALGVMPPKE
ncbi:hypothetical protein [Microbacterium aurantiacum]|uniref:hypothetical protein n=1 Tax=Microbacterium aurantiacum TaxID=162393 RepID=UPI000C80BE1B|nr:hypothetical protein [Microbacterium aurantiacum]